MSKNIRLKMKMKIKFNEIDDVFMYIIAMFYSLDRKWVIMADDIAWM
jgi:hypothetical protein